MPRIAAVLATAAILVLTACGGESESIAFPERAVNVPDLAEAGVVTGEVRFTGLPITRRRVTTACGSEILDETVVVTDGKLADVLVFIEEGAEDWVFPWEESEAEIDQLGCRFAPHVLAVRARQPIRIRNSDPLAHNIHVTGKTQPGFIVSFPGRDSAVRQLAKPELSMRTTCDLHANMLMYIHVLDHPYFAVTGTDGRFEIPDLPPGTYRLAALHEELGQQSRTLVIPPSGRVESFDFEFAR